MTVNPIQIAPLEAMPEPATWLRTPSIAPMPTFETQLLGALATLEQGVEHAHTQVQRVALGEAVPTHQVMLALEDARLSLKFALAVRTRLVEAYQDVMRMQL